uniref:NADH dehydrogenase subunit 6 n=1 Tax=Lamennaisia ambigua TaxID=3064205 RepID=UPI00286BEE7C|nr:NADH dehydrogenase subunit 6 [Lamennaisia ambigua]WKV28910.1 NADH dehydrogenase subunit 6 [Lamennaisia ambigua]
MMKFLNILIMVLINLSTLLLMINLLPMHYNHFHPLILGSILMIFNIMFSLNLSLYLYSSWWSFISFLIIIGGLMILFLYFTSFINNMIMSIKLIFLKNYFFKILICLMFLMIMFYKFNEFSIWYNYIPQIYKNKIYKILFMYMYNLNMSMMISIFYLLMSLTFLVKMLISNKFTLRKLT